ncbi:hypothetical protein [uncultured Polaribacter sp.]|uniref:hypothetical protein n=1 Tax=uncultured Polaribacter sp. TaxID=174711 RepID=UPI0026176E1C|nr:hypothetical protein [uncultured Polaribacter sp.]
MSILNIKNKIVEEINTIQDASILKKVLSYLEKVKENNVSEEQLIYYNKKKSNSLSEKDIVAYSIKGTPISRETYIKNNEQAIESFRNGNFKTQKQILEKYQKKA